jgi:uncharacterized C2H2 Zn-finger protein
MKAMATDYNDGNQLIRCPNCKASITIEELHEYVNAKPESKREAREDEIEMWGPTYYDRQYLVENIVFCPTCARISHSSDWLGVSW